MEAQLDTPKSFNTANYVTSIDKVRLFAQKELSRAKLYNLCKDKFAGCHERDIMRIVNRFQQITNYSMSEQEIKIFKKGKWRRYAMTTLGVIMPLGFLLSSTWRPWFVGTKIKKLIFGSVCFSLAYSNYVSSYANLLYKVTNLDDSAMAFVTFQIMCQPPYRKYRNKFQTSYNLSSIAHRYENFDFERAMSIGVNGNDIDISLNINSMGNNENDEFNETNDPNNALNQAMSEMTNEMNINSNTASENEQNE